MKKVLLAAVLSLYIPMSAQTINPTQVRGLVKAQGVNLVGAGDSRMAGTTLGYGQDLLTQISLQPQFTGYANMHNGAHGGDTCANMTSAYAANVQPYKPSGAVTTSYLFIEVGINDIVFNGQTASQVENCYSAYLNQAVADGFTPVPITVYYSGAATDAQDLIRQQLNQWIRGLPYLVMDADTWFPSITYDPWKLGGVASTYYAISHYSIASNVGTFYTSNTLTAGQLVYLYGFLPTSDYLNNTIVSVISATSTQFTASVIYPNITSADTGAGQIVLPTPDLTHLGPQGIVLLAKEINAAWGSAQSGSTIAVSGARDFLNPPSGALRINGGVVIGVPSNLANNGTITLSQSANTGAVFFGGDSTSYLARNIGGDYLFQMGTEGGGIVFKGATRGLQYFSSIAACATFGTCMSDAMGNLYSVGSSTSGGLAFGNDGGWTLSRSGTTTNWHTPDSVALDHGFSATLFAISGTPGFTGTKTAGSCVLTINGGIITNVTGC